MTADDAPWTPCVDGIHDTVEARAPVDHGACVNIDYACADCGALVWTVSWTKTAWIVEQAKAAARDAKQAAAVTPVVLVLERVPS